MQKNELYCCSNGDDCVKSNPQSLSSFSVRGDSGRRRRQCKGCMLLYKKNYFKEHKDEKRENYKQYRKENDGRIKEYQKQYRKENKDKKRIFNKNLRKKSK